MLNVLNSRGIRLRLFVAALVLVASLILISLVAACFRGLDMTDEGFYLNWMANPQEYQASVSQFGYVYSVWFRLVGESVPLVRVINVLFTFGLGWLLFSIVSRNLEKSMRLVVGFVGGTIALGGFDTHLLTPNYNTLNLQGLLLFSVGILSWENSKYRWQTLSIELLVALGGVLVFLAKPTTALLLVGVFFAAHVASGRVEYIRVARVAFGVLGLASASALLIDGSFGLFIERYQIGLEMVRAQGANHGLFTLAEALSWDSVRRVGGLVASLWLVLMVCKVGGGTVGAYGLSLRTGLLLLVFGAFVSPTVREFFYLSRGKQHLLGLFIATAFIYQNVGRRQVVQAVLFLVLPFIFANGTSNNMWFATGLVDVFWFAGAVFLVINAAQSQSSRRVLIAVMALGLLILSARLRAGWQTPYRQPDALWSYERELEKVDRLKNVKIASLTADYLESALGVISESGFSAGDVILDLSGQSPGLVFVAGGVSPGQPWNLRGYPGSKERLRIALMTVSCERLVSSWIVMHDDSTIGFKEDSMRAVGLDFESYLKVGAWSALAYDGKVMFGSQSFYAPHGDVLERVKRCEDLRYELDTETRE